MERHFRSLEELYFAKPKPGPRDRSLRFMSCLPGLADRNFLQRLVWRFYHYPLFRLHISLEQQNGFQIKEGDDWVTQEYKQSMQKNTPK